MNVIAKFTVVSITDNGPHAAKQVKLNCTYDTTIPEDQRFLKATPWGEITMLIDNPLALDEFTHGRQFYATFSPVAPTGTVGNRGTIVGSADPA